MTQTLSFTKMHGLGNDFVIVDARNEAVDLSTRQIRALADRRTGVGCDQLVIVENSTRGDAFMRIYNADGGEVSACGNATRCVAYLLMEHHQNNQAVIETKADILYASRESGDRITVNMGQPRLEWQDIPLSQKMDTLHMDISEGVLKDPVGVSMGNPHAVFFVRDIDTVPLETLGPKLEHHPLFPERANIGVAQIIAPDHILLRVFERGAGETLACGTGACAALVAASRRGLSARRATIHLKGGELEIDWRDTGEVFMTGPVSPSFSGIITPLHTTLHELQRDDE